MMFVTRLLRLALGVIFFAGTLYGDELTRKFDTAAFFQSVAKTCNQAGKVAGAQTQKEKQQAACELVGSVCETAAVLSEKTKTRSLGYEYLQALSVLPTDKDREEYIAKILANKEEGLFFLNELFALAKVLLIEEIPGFIDKIHQDTVKNLKFDEK